jgi:hypothetical protein
MTETTSTNAKFTAMMIARISLRVGRTGKDHRRISFPGLRCGLIHHQAGATGDRCP